MIISNFTNGELRLRELSCAMSVNTKLQWPYTISLKYIPVQKTIFVQHEEMGER